LRRRFGGAPDGLRLKPARSTQRHVDGQRVERAGRQRERITG